MDMAAQVTDPYPIGQHLSYHTIIWDENNAFRDTIPDEGIPQGGALASFLHAGRVEE